MKKIIAILTLIFSLTFAGLFDTTYSIVKRDASLNQVNGGEEEFVIAQQIKNKEEFIIKIG